MPVRNDSRPWAWVFAGLLAVSVIVMAQSLDARGLLEGRASWWRVLLQLPAHLLLLVSWWRIGPRFQRPLTVAALWGLPLLFSLPLHSRDVYSYIAQGWLMGEGLNPYLVRSGDAGFPGLLTGTHWHQTTSVYPSLALQIFGLVDKVFGPSIHWMIVGMRVPNILAMILLAWAVAKLAAQFGVPREWAWWLGVANPILLVQWIGGSHNDAIMVALIAVALVVVLRPGWLALVVGGVVLGTAMGIKQSAALAGLGLVAVAWQSRLRDGARGWWRLLATAVVPGIATVATFLALSYGSGLGLGWRASTAGNPISASSNAPFSWVASFGRFHAIADPETVNAVVTGVSMVVILIALVALVWWIGPKADDPGRPWLLLVSSLLTFGFIGPALQPWYVTWVIPFVALARLRGWLRIAWWGVLIVFTALPPLQDAMPPYVAMAVVAVPLAGLLWWWGKREPDYA